MLHIKHSKVVPLGYRQITEHIYLGTNQCCQTHFAESLLAIGIRADISLEQERLDAPYGVDYYLWLPVVDKTPPSQEQLIIGSKTVKNLVDNNIKIYIHCKWGHGRSPTLVAAYFILEGLKANQAIRKVRDKREIHLALSQINALKEFEELLAKQ
ncbi:dual specificity protein phosphatase family protein [Chloroflexota bacterium]